MLGSLSGYKKFSESLIDNWEDFSSKRNQLLTQQIRYGSAPEKIAEDIVKVFLSTALDWSIGDINNQVQYADIVLTSQGIKRLVIETKKPDSINNQMQFNKAITQAHNYATKQRVNCIAISDGNLFYAADIVNGGLKDRINIKLSAKEPSPNLYWLSVDGIYRLVENLDDANSHENNFIEVCDNYDLASGNQLLIHPKYKVPAYCFAYVGNSLKTTTWKLPYRLINTKPDEKHLPGAIRAILTNYRGAHNKSIPEAAIPDVLVRLGKAAYEAGKMPGQTRVPVNTYQLLYEAISQLNRIDEITK